MESIDTGKLSIRIGDNLYLHTVVYTDQELTSDDIPEVVRFLDQFDAPLLILLERRGNYSLAPLVQVVMYQQTKYRLEAVAFLDRDERDANLTRIAADTYLQHTRVRSFFDKEEAVNWLRQFAA